MTKSGGRRMARIDAKIQSNENHSINSRLPRRSLSTRRSFTRRLVGEGG
jgi:hypothetical protein